MRSTHFTVAGIIAKTSLGDGSRFAATNLIVNLIVDLIDFSHPTFNWVDDSVKENDRMGWRSHTVRSWAVSSAYLAISASR